MMLITPRVSEKSYKMAADNVYVFDVPLNASKAETIEAIESQYEGVKIKDVRMLITKGKPKAINRGKRSRPGKANRKDTKKAYVTVLEGKIEISAFSEIENQAKAEEAETAKVETKEAKTESSTKSRVVSRRTTAPDTPETSEKKGIGGLFAKKRTGRRGDR